MPFLRLFRTGESESGPADVDLIHGSLSTIIISRFHLDLQRNAQSNTNVSQVLPTISIGSFRATSRRVHNAAMAEFGGSFADESVEAEAAEDDIVTLHPDMSSGMTGDEIELGNFQSH